jgi:hypothetical protein
VGARLSGSAAKWKRTAEVGLSMGVIGPDFPPLTLNPKALPWPHPRTNEYCACAFVCAFAASAD